MRAQFVLSEVMIGLRRNLTMTIAVIVTVAISLALVGMALLVSSQVATMKDYWYDKVEVSIFLKKGVTQDQRELLQRELAANPEVKDVFYESKEQAYERFLVQFKDSPALTESITPDALPESFRVKLADPEEFEVVSSEFEGKPGVDTVLNQRVLLDKFFRILNALRTFAIVIAVFQLAASVLLISNTIRVAAFSRRRETGIMRLVGASNLYIQLPFLLEGALAGLIGVGIAVTLIALVQRFFVNAVLRPEMGFMAFIGWDAVLGVVPWLLLIGVGLSALASFVTLRRHLRV